MADLEPADEPTWVYRCYCSHYGLLYVGVAADVRRRLHQHTSKPWWPHVEYVLAERFASRAAALEVEAHTIRYDRPQHNIAGAPTDSDLHHRIVERRDYYRDDKRHIVAFADAPRTAS